MAQNKKAGKRISKKTQRQAARTREKRMKQIRYGGLALIVVIAIAGIILWRNANAVPLDELAASTAPNLDGPESAPVQVVEYGDLGCSSCRAWHNAGIKEQLKAQFDDQVAFEYRHFPVITANSPDAAEAAQCAAEQDAFWTFHNYIYENLPAYPALDRSSLKEYATAVNLDRTAFDACLDSHKYESYVFNHAQQARAAGARGTPTFVVNGSLVASPSYENMAQLIDSALQEQG